MDIVTTQDLWYFIATFCAVIITGFLVWALYEIARLVRQANEMLKDTRGKVERFEAALCAIGEKFSSVSSYLAFIAEGAKQVFTYIRKRSRKKEKELKEE